MTGIRDDFATARYRHLTARPLVMGRRGVIAAGHHLATAAGSEIMRAGGNAIDAGVAAGIAINVLLFDRTNFAGVAPIIIYHAASGSCVTLDGLGCWPAGADIDRVRESGSGEGILRSVIPGAPDSWLTALARYGSLSLREVLQPAYSLAHEGAPVSRGVAKYLRQCEDRFADLDPEARRIFFPGDRAPTAGESLRQRDLAGTFEMLREAEAEARSAGRSRSEAILRARDCFYAGAIAEEIAEFHEKNSGWITYEDLAHHSVEIDEPQMISYGEYEVLTCGFWCQGPMLLQFLNILEHFDLADMQPESPEYVHLLVETMDHVFADRETFYADPRHQSVPMTGLLAKEYAREIAGMINMQEASGQMPRPGNPYRYEPGMEDREVERIDPTPYIAGDDEAPGDTSYVAAADEEGNIFSATPSDRMFWTPIIPGLGFSCSGRGIQSRTDPEHPCRIAPGMRPRLTPNPALIMQGGQPLLGIGCPGGDAQTQGMLQVLLHMMHHRMNPQEAVEAPRAISRNFPNSFAPHHYYPGRVEIERGLAADTGSRLQEMGHDVRVVPAWAPLSSSVHVVLRNPRNAVLLGASDPRTEGSAMGL